MITLPTNPRASTLNRADRFREETPCSLVRLSAGSAYRIPRHVRTIRCVSGKLWLTRANDSRDTVLISGQETLIHGVGVAVQALEDAVLRI